MRNHLFPLFRLSVALVSFASWAFFLSFFRPPLLLLLLLLVSQVAKLLCINMSGAKVTFSMTINCSLRQRELQATASTTREHRSDLSGGQERRLNFHELDEK